MSSTVTSSSNFQSIFDTALSDYAKKTGIDLATHPFCQTLQSCNSPNGILDLLDEKSKKFQAYRDGNRKLIDFLKPVVQLLHTVSGILGGVAALVSLLVVMIYLVASLPSCFQVPFPPTQAILVSIDVLLTVRITKFTPSVSL
jgi:hypothetical protein